MVRSHLTITFSCITYCKYQLHRIRVKLSKTELRNLGTCHFWHRWSIRFIFFFFSYKLSNIEFSVLYKGMTRKEERGLGDVGAFYAVLVWLKLHFQQWIQKQKDIQCLVWGWLHWTLLLLTSIKPGAIQGGRHCRNIISYFTSSELQGKQTNLKALFIF